MWVAMSQLRAGFELYAPRLEVLPSPESADRDLAICCKTPLRIAVLERFEEGMVVEIAGLLRDAKLTGMRGVCLGRSATNADRVTVALRDGRRFNVRAENLTRYDQIAVEQLVPENGRSAVALRVPRASGARPRARRTIFRMENHETR